LLIGVLLASAAVLARGLVLQVVEGERWSARAVDQQRQQVALPAPRGTIFDRNGVPLAASQVTYRVSVAPREVRDRAGVTELLREALGLSAAEAARAVDRGRRWVVLPGRHDAVAYRRLAGTRGLYFERVQERFHPHGEVGLEVLGRLAVDGTALGGVELAFDSLLSGRAGLAVERRDARGEVIPGSLLSVVEPVAGHDLYLTLDLGLQEIAHEALREAVRETGSAGGDLLLADRRTGEILAAVSHRSGEATAWRGVLDPYEPGSTLKPFFVSSLLVSGRATLGDSVFAEEGRYTNRGRTVTDVEKHGWLTVGEALSVSSNVAMVKLAEDFAPAVQYSYLRDFGFGTPTGVPYPAEAAGVLRRPRDWSAYSQGSLAIGYEISVTPLQMVMAYGALANEGVLMEPRIVREVRSREGRVVRRYSPRVVRRVLPAEVSRAVSAALLDVVETGSGRRAQLGSFPVAGKTGTARRFVDGRYDRGGYTASFAGFFPAADPQLAFLVKLDRPQGAYYGGTAAAPVTRTTLAAALAARSTALDRRVVASTAGSSEVVSVPVGTNRSVVAEGPWLPPVPGPFIFSLGTAPARRYESASAARPRPVPNVRGLAVRDAVRRLHGQGFRVEVEGVGVVAGTTPVAGRSLEPGAVVVVRGEASR
jgi:cell division protein FtsI (penicillin-binding protein 3)